MPNGVLGSTPAVLRGPLSQSAMVQVLRALFVGQLTGRLRFTRDGEHLDLRFLSGHIVSGASEPVKGRLGEILTRSGVLSRIDLDKVVEQAGGEGRRLGPLLMELGLANMAQIEEALRLQVRGVLFTAFFWRTGTFQFEPNDGSPSEMEEISPGLSTAQLILEVVSSLDEPLSVREALGDLDRRVASVEGPRVRLEGVTLSPGDAFVLSRADGVLTARQILEITPLPQEAVERSLLSLLSVGVVEWRTPQQARGSNPNHTVGLSQGEVRQAIEARLVEEIDHRQQEIDETFSNLLGKTHYDVLGLPNTSTAEEVREAYQGLTRRFHPDTAGQMSPDKVAKVHAIFMRVSEAYNALRTAVPSGRVDPQRVAAGPTPQDAPKPEGAKAAAAPGRSLEETLTQAEEALSSRPWETLAAVERVFSETAGPVRQRVRVLRARAQLKNPISWRAGEQELRELQQEDPTFLDPVLLLGGFYRDRGLTARATAMFSKVLEMRPGHRRATEELGKLPVPAGSGRVGRAVAVR